MSSRLETTALSWEPRIFLVRDFLSADERARIIEIARPGLRPSVALDKSVPNKRTSQGTFLSGALASDPVVLALRARAAQLTLLPAEHGEPIQVLRYAPGEEYKNHVDYIPPKSAQAAKRMARGGQRLCTVLMYLNDVEEGGQTLFPRAGVEVPARQGDAVLFFNVRPDHQVDPRTLHAGAPVIEGEKWLATLWVRERPYEANPR